jgi:hypothetical protein
MTKKEIILTIIMTILSCQTQINKRLEIYISILPFVEVINDQKEIFQNDSRETQIQIIVRKKNVKNLMNISINETVAKYSMKRYSNFSKA